MTPLARVSRSLGAASIAALALTCSSDHSTTPAGSVDVVHAPAIPAADLAKSYGLEIRPEVVEGVPIRVVDATSGKPVGDALVVSVDETEFTYSDSGDGGITWNTRMLLQHSGIAYATPADGVVRVAPQGQPRSIFVWHGADFGRTTLEVYDRKEHEVRLAPRALMVEVVDKNGRPQSGVRIQMGKCSLEPMSAGTTLGSTGADGRFAIPALELERGVHRSCGRRNLIMFGDLVRGFELRPADAPVLEPVRFELPDCGTVEVVLQDPRGRLLTAESSPGRNLILWVRPESVETPGEPRGADRSMTTSDPPDWHSLPLLVRPGPYRLEHVETGTRLRFTLVASHRKEGLTYPDSQEIPVAVLRDDKQLEWVNGPSRAGEVAKVVVRVQSNDADVDNTTLAPSPEPAHAPEIPADAESSIAVAVQCDFPIKPCSLCARLDGNRDEFEHDACPWIDVNGRATMRQVPAGLHSVEITRRNFDPHSPEIVVATVDDVRVERHQHLRDPRLIHLDLSGKLRAHRFEVVDASGHPLTGFVHVTSDDEPYEDRFFHFDAPGRVSFMTAAREGVHASIGVERFRLFDLDLKSSLSRIVMRRGIPIRLALDPHCRMPIGAHDQIYFGVYESPNWNEFRDPLRTVALRPDADARFDVAMPGDHDVIFLRKHLEPDGTTTIEQCNAVTSTVTVRDRNEEQRLVVSPDSDCWNQLLRSIGEGD